MGAPDLTGTADAGQLFDLGAVQQRALGPANTYVARLTIRNKALLEAGRHPATHMRTMPELGTCGDCAHHHRYGYRNRSYNKCDVHRLGESHSEASDIRVSWPACEAFTPKEPTG